MAEFDPTEEAEQLDFTHPRWQPDNEKEEPHWYSGWGFNEDTAYLGPLYRLSSAIGTAAAKGEQLMAASWRNMVFHPLNELTDQVWPSAPGKEYIQKAEDTLEDVKFDARRRLAALRPDPRTTGASVQVVHGLTEGLATATIGEALGGPVGAFSLMGASEGVSAFDELRQANVRPSVAAVLAGIRGSSAGLGVVVPIAWGGNLLSRLATGAGSNATFGIVDRGLDSAILRHAGYKDMADQEQPFDRDQLLFDLALGGAFGGWAHLAATGNEPVRKAIDRLKDNQRLRDAAMVGQLSNADRRAGPGVPTSNADMEAHIAALTKAVQDINTGQKVDVTGTGVEDSTVIARGGRDNPAVHGVMTDVLRESGILDEADKLKLWEQTLAKRLGEKVEPETQEQFTKVDPKSDERREEPKAGTTEAEELEKVTTAAGREIRVRHRLAELEDLITSDKPEYPPELQPRDRSRAASTEQIHDIATNLVPERLAHSAEADRGAPIVGEDNVVEAGNGRVAALREVYSGNKEKEAEYRAMLQKQGFDTTGFKQPVLVRERRTPLTPVEREKFAIEANQSATGSMSSMERGAADAKQLDTGMLTRLRDGDMHALNNVPFVRSFLEGIPVSERGPLLDSKGRLSIEGVRRLQAAILTKAYGGTEYSASTLGRLLEDTAPEQRNILGALSDVAPAVARLRQMISDGVIDKRFDPTKPIMEAVDDARRINEQRGSLEGHVAQGDMLTPRDPFAEAMLKAFYNDAGTRAAGRQKIADSLRAYVAHAIAERLDEGRLFAEPPQAPEELMTQALSEARPETAEQQQAQMQLEEQKAKAETAPGDTIPAMEPSFNFAEMVLKHHPNIELPTAEGVVRGDAALEAAKEGIKDAETDVPEVFKNAVDCALRNGAD